MVAREKRRDMTQSYDKSSYTHGKTKKQRDNTQTPPKTSITQRLRTDIEKNKTQLWLSLNECSLALTSVIEEVFGRYGDLIKQYEDPLSQILTDNPTPIRLYTNPWPFYRTRPFTDLWEVSIEHLRRVLHANRGRLLHRTPGPVLFGTCIYSTSWD